MIDSSAEFGAVLDGKGRRPRVGRFTLDVPAMPGIDLSQVRPQSIHLDVQGTDLPAQVRDTAGFTSIGGNIVLTGPIAPMDSRSIAWLFNPDNADSPFYRQTLKGQPCSFSWGLRIYGQPDPELIDQFTGTVDSYVHDSQAGTVTLTLTDIIGGWADTPDIPAVCTAPPFNAGLTSEFAMDALIRSQNGPAGSTWPATRPECLLAAGMRSSVWPEVGTLDASSAYAQPPGFAPGVNGSAYTVGARSFYYNPTYLLATPLTGPALFVEWQHTGSGSGISFVNRATNETIAISRTAGMLTVQLYHFGGGSTETHYDYATDSTDPYTSVAVTLPDVGGTGWSAVLTVGGDSQATGPLSTATRETDAWTTATLWVDSADSTLGGVQVTTETDPPSNYGWVPAAVLDQSLNPLTVVPEIALGTRPGDELQTMAAAEFGYIRCDESGVIRFDNRKTLAFKPITKLIHSGVNLKPGTSTSVGGSTQYGQVTVPYTEWTFGGPTAIYVLDTVKYIPPGQTITWTQAFDTPAANIDTVANLLPDGHDPMDGQSWYRCSRDPNGQVSHPNLLVTLTQVGASSVTVNVTNQSRYGAYLTTPASNTDFTAGQAGTGLWIGGRPAMASDERLITIGTKGKVLPLDSNGYLQDAGAALAIGDYIAPIVAEPIRDFAATSIIPDPRVQVSDIGQLQDPARSGIDEYVYVWGKSLDIAFADAESSGTCDMTVSLRAAGPPGSVLLGFPGRSRLGDDAGDPGTFYLYP